MRTLLITSSLPWPTHGGGNQRTNLIYRALRRHGDVDTVVISRYGHITTDKWEAIKNDFGGRYLYEERLKEHRAPWTWLRPISPSLPSRMAHAVWGWGVDFVPDREVATALRPLVEREDYDLIVGRYMWSLARSGAMGLRPTLLDVDDFETDVIEADLEAQQPEGLKRRWIERRLRQVATVEKRVLSRCGHVWVAKAGDVKRVGHPRSSILPNIPFVKAGQAGIDPCPPHDGAKNVLMVGTLEHPINTRSIDVFLSGPWRQIHRQVPDARFQIVGSGMTDAMRSRWGAVPGVEPIGFADDLRQAYTDAAITVVPIREGGGTKIKVLESMMYGRACVSTDYSLRGYDHVLKHDRSIFVASDDTEFVEGCVRLLNDPAKRRALADEGGRLVREHFSLDRFMTTVDVSIDAVLGKNTTARSLSEARREPTQAVS